MSCPKCGPLGQSTTFCFECSPLGPKAETAERKIERLKSMLRKQDDDRARRIRELALTWASQKVHYAPEVKKLIELAAEIIDAIDAAEIPPRESGEG